MHTRLPSPLKFVKGADGSVTIEFVVTIPLFLAALAFAFEFGQAFLAHQSTVNNVRSASRYLARVPVSQAASDCARAIVQTGKLNMQDSGLCPLPSTSSYPSYLAPESATIEVTQDNARVRIRARVDFPLSIFGLAADAAPAIPFVVVEDVRYVGL